uniref:Secreted protein n=1 Tax=Arundo donax TaxID=35708 RepID=A0A0A8YNQ6_ARUDO
MLEAWCHFIHPALILWLTSSSMSPSFCSTDPKYRKVSFWSTILPSKLTSHSSCLLANSHLIYSIFVLLSLKPFDSRVCLQSS